MSDTPKPAYTRTNVQRFVSLLAADDNISRHAYALLESAGEISYDEMATYRAEAYATSIELQNAKKHLELAENALQRNETLISQLKEQVEQLTKAVLQSSAMILHPCRAVDDKDEQLAAITAENDFLKEKVVELGGIIEGFTPRSKSTWTFNPMAHGYTLATPQMPTSEPGCPVAWATINIIPDVDATINSPGWRMLKASERIQWGDQYRRKVHSRDFNVWDYVLGGFGSLPSEHPDFYFQRKSKPEEPKPATETPKNPFASYVAPKKEQKYRELGENDTLQPGDFWVFKSRFNDKASRYEITEEDITRRYPVDSRAYGKSAEPQYGFAYIRPITEKEAE